MWSTDLEYYFSAAILSSSILPFTHRNSVRAICRRSADNSSISRFAQKYCDRFVMLACHSWHCSGNMRIQFRWNDGLFYWGSLLFMKNEIVIVSPSVLNSTIFSLSFSIAPSRDEKCPLMKLQNVNVILIPTRLIALIIVSFSCYCLVVGDTIFWLRLTHIVTTFW